MIPELFSVGKSLKAVYDFSQKASNFFFDKKDRCFQRKPAKRKVKGILSEIKR